MTDNMHATVDSAGADVVGTTKSDRARIRVSNVSKRYAGKSGVLALDDVNLEVDDGEFVCLVGPSGCGKSTLLLMMNSLHRPSSGQVEIVTSSSTKVATSMVFQDYSIFPWMTVEQNVRFGLSPSIPRAEVNSRVDYWLEKMGLSQFKNAFPGTLSGGMRQRVSIARAIIVQPDVILMDEPFAALDAQLRRVLQDELLALWQEDRRTVVFVTHSIEEAILLGDRIIVMSARPGRIVADIRVPFSRPRSSEVRLDPEFARLEQEVWDLLRIQGSVDDSTKDELAK